MNRPTKTKPTDNLPRVFRGGSWVNSDAARVRAAFRFWFAPSNHYYFLGFRCALRGRAPLKVTP